MKNTLWRPLVGKYEIMCVRAYMPGSIRCVRHVHALSARANGVNNMPEHGPNLSSACHALCNTKQATISLITLQNSPDLHARLHAEDESFWECHLRPIRLLISPKCMCLYVAVSGSDTFLSRLKHIFTV